MKWKQTWDILVNVSSFIVADIRDAAAYIFRNDPESLERYPSLYARSASKKKPPKVDIEAAAPQPTE